MRHGKTLASFKLVENQVEMLIFFIKFIKLKYVFMPLAMVKYINFFEYFASVVIQCFVDNLQKTTYLINQNS